MFYYWLVSTIHRAQNDASTSDQFVWTSIVSILLLLKMRIFCLNYCCFLECRCFFRLQFDAVFEGHPGGSGTNFLEPSSIEFRLQMRILPERWKSNVPDNIGSCLRVHNVATWYAEHLAAREMIEISKCYFLKPGKNRICFRTWY